MPLALTRGIEDDMLEIQALSRSRHVASEQAWCQFQLHRMATAVGNFRHPASVVAAV